jgi:hypothetical protein
MPIFCNNCRRRDHIALFGEGAFYDLNREGRQATMATNLRPGDECVVATPDGDGDIVFNWFSFSHEAIMRDDEGDDVRVLFGKWLRSETLSRSDAAGLEPYSVFFNVKRHFKRMSIIPSRSGHRKQAATRRG